MPDFFAIAGDHVGFPDFCGFKDGWNTLAQDTVLQPGHGQRGYPNLFAVQRVGIKIIEEHIDIMGHHMLTHASGMTGIGNADSESHQRTNSDKYAECF